MATNWVQPNWASLSKALSILVIEKQAQNVAAETAPNTPVDWDSDTNVSEQVRMAVAEVRAAINKAGQFPLSVTTGAVPPEHESTALNIAAWRVISGNPSLAMFVMSEKGVSSPFKSLYDKALKEVEALRNGESFTLPSDPTGRDYATAVDATTNPAIATIRYGGMQDKIAQDLTTEDFNPDTV